MTDRRIDYVPLADVQRALRNAKRHDAAGIAVSIARFGVIDVPTIDDRTGRLVAGHGRVEDLTARVAAGAEPPDGVRIADDGSWLVPVVAGWSSENDDEAHAAGIALNHLTESGGWDVADLTDTLDGFRDTAGLLAATGYTERDLDDLLASMRQPTPEPDADDDPATSIMDTIREVAKRGDVWDLGGHRVMCGDCRNPDDVATLVDGQVVNLAFTSPPYADRRDYDETSGFEPIDPDLYVEWFAPVAANVAAHLAPDGSWFVNIKPGADGLDTHLYVFDLVAAHVREWGWHFATELCWERTGVPKQPVLRFKNGFEPVYQFARGRWKFHPERVRHASDNVPMSLGEGSGDTSWKGRQGNGGVIGDNRRPRKNGRRGGSPVDEKEQGSGGAQMAPCTHLGAGLAYPSNRVSSFVSTHEATGHTASFPVGLPEWFVRVYSDSGDVVFDPFLGSGSTLLAAHHQNRRCVGMEISPRYVDVILARWQRHTGVVPVNTTTGEPADMLLTASASEA